MWAVSYLPPPTPPCHPLVRNLNKQPLNLRSLSVSAKSQPPGQDLGGLGHSILTKLKSNHKPTTPILSKQKQKQKQKQRQNQEGKQIINGSDVLFALQKAADKKSREIGKKKKKANVSSSSSSSSYVGSHREEEGVDEDGKVRPLCVKGEWGDRLDELEKRFQELSSKVI
ncbi:uncharacterized protein Pyn_33147 [Prunus yedoensis var. nudiflora]|uniref:Uncharacterized protein n=1 Tax=Prunus yedoensis var. nudiflora TaxID=2094558 RepID=A0A314Y337_PRUYE|nr:uncharacterized protein Pyn_33147 [Prunus yedoensis var. nudiflora]